MNKKVFSKIGKQREAMEDWHLPFMRQEVKGSERKGERESEGLKAQTKKEVSETKDRLEIRRYLSLLSSPSPT